MLASSFQNKLIEAGCDEAGRGCLAGPVYAAAVILPKKYKNSLLNDSKQLSEKKRNQLRIEIERDALAFGVGIVDNQKIDEINILKASFLAMHLAVEQLNTTPELLLIDGNRFTPYPSIPHKCIIKGDAKFLSIAAASVLAKTYRDEFLEKMHHEFPVYDWNKNKAYPTKKHRESIIKHGITPYHRKSYNLFPTQQKLDLEF